MTLVLVVWLVMTVLPAIKAIGFALALAAGFVGAFTVVFALIEEETKPFLIFRKQLKWILPLLVVAALTPNKETTWYMVGAYGTQKIVESPVAQELAGDGVDVLKSLMRKAKEHIDEIDAKESPKVVDTKK